MMNKHYRMLVTDKSKAISELKKENISAIDEDLGIYVTLKDQNISYVILLLNEKKVVVYDVEELVL